MNTQVVPPPGPLLAQMPSGRDIHGIKAYVPPALDRHVLEAMRAPPTPLDQQDEPVGDEASSDEEHGRPGAPRPVGSYPGTAAEYGGERSSSTYY